MRETFGFLEGFVLEINDKALGLLVRRVVEVIADKVRADDHGLLRVSGQKLLCLGGTQDEAIPAEEAADKRVSGVLRHGLRVGPLVAASKSGINRLHGSTVEALRRQSVGD